MPSYNVNFLLWIPVLPNDSIATLLFNTFCIRFPLVFYWLYRYLHNQLSTGLHSPRDQEERKHLIFIKNYLKDITYKNNYLPLWVSFSNIQWPPKYKAHIMSYFDYTDRTAQFHFQIIYNLNRFQPALSDMKLHTMHSMLWTREKFHQGPEGIFFIHVHKE